MNDTLIAPKYSLTAEDLKLIVAVAEETARDGGMPIALVRGPETQEALRKWFPKNDGWANLQRLGTMKTNGDPTKAGARGLSRPSQRFTKRVQYLFKSPKWPNGIPVGVYGVETQRVQYEDDYKETTSTKDIAWDEEQRLLFLSKGKRKLTDRQIREDQDRKEAMRAKRVDDDLTKTPAQQMAEALAAAMKNLTPAAPEKAEKGR